MQDKWILQFVMQFRGIKANFDRQTDGHTSHCSFSRAMWPIKRVLEINNVAC